MKSGNPFLLGVIILGLTLFDRNIWYEHEDILRTAHLTFRRRANIVLGWDSLLDSVPLALVRVTLIGCTAPTIAA